MHKNPRSTNYVLINIKIHTVISIAYFSPQYCYRSARGVNLRTAKARRGVRKNGTPKLGCPCSERYEGKESGEIASAPGRWEVRSLDRLLLV